MLGMGPKPDQQLAFGVLILTAISLKGFFTHSSMSKYILAGLLIQSGVVDDNMNLLRQFSQAPFHSILVSQVLFPGEYKAHKNLNIGGS